MDSAFGPDARRKQHDDEGERAALQLAIAVFPQREYARCMLAALDARRGDTPGDAAPIDCSNESQ
jgi:hypothetical protein